MEPKDFNLYEYCIIRFVPSVDRGEFANVGILMMCKRQKWIKCEIRINEERLKAFFGDIDLALLRRQLKPFTLPAVPFPGLPVEERYRWLCAVKSASIQTSPSHPGIATTSLDRSFADLISAYL